MRISCAALSSRMVLFLFLTVLLVAWWLTYTCTPNKQEEFILGRAMWRTTVKRWLCITFVLGVLMWLLLATC